MKLTPGVNLTNVLRTAFMLVDPKSIKNTVKLSVSFLGSASVKAVHRTLMKLSSGGWPRSIWTGFSWLQPKAFYTQIGFSNSVNRKLRNEFGRRIGSIKRVEIEFLEKAISKYLPQKEHISIPMLFTRQFFFVVIRTKSKVRKRKLPNYFD